MVLSTHLLDFQFLPTDDENVFLIQDTSKYREAPENPAFDIVLPGYTTANRVFALPNKVNMIDSTLLFQNDSLEAQNPVALSDGIWEFKYMIQPYPSFAVTKYCFRTVSLEKRLDIALSSIEVHRGSVLKVNDSLFVIRMLIEGAKASLRLGNKIRGRVQYDEAVQLASKLENQLSNCR